MLYTLSVFALEPVRWIERYEWRSFTDFEMCATGTFWKSVGDKMQISFAPLHSASTGWHDGLHWLKEVRDWSERYETRNMIPAESNHLLASAHLQVIFTNLPPSLQKVGHWIVSFLVGDRLRKAMKFDPAPAIFEAVIATLLRLRVYVLRYMALPRPEFRRKSYISVDKESNGRYSAKEYLSHPWYVKPTLSSRWGPKAWFLRIIGRKLPGDDGDRYHPEGYVISEIGPLELKDKGRNDMKTDIFRINALQPGGCPFGKVK